MSSYLLSAIKCPKTFSKSGRVPIAIYASDETINYEYDSNGRISGIYSNKGWERNNIAYNPFGSVTGEVQVIFGLSSKTLQYEYDANNILKKVIYPNGKSAVYTNNGLNMPETAAFNGLNLVSQISYGVGKQPAASIAPGRTNNFNIRFSPTSAGLKMRL